MSAANFCHLNVHSEFSELAGAARVPALVAKAAALGMQACALTDHASLFGVIDFYQAAENAGIKPIIGCDFYLAHGSRHDKQGRSSNASPLLCWAETLEGYFNLCRLSSYSYIEGYHYRPRIDLELLAQYRAGLIASTGGRESQIPQLMLQGRHAEVEKTLERYLEIFGTDNLVVEIQNHGLEEERILNPQLADLAKRHGLLLIATNDVHYVEQDDAEAHDVLLAIQTQAKLDDERRLRFAAQNYHFCTAEEMAERLPEYPEALSNTAIIAERCNVQIPLGQHLIPEYEPPAGKEKFEYLRELVMLGLDDRYSGNPTQEHIDRAEFELDVIRSMQFVDYFLVVWDLINFARSAGIPVGPGRGSGAGSLVAFALQITNIDPIRYKLIFERFLNPERVSMPDFDIDFCFERREEMITYTREKYGDENVSQIITFGRMLAKNVIRSVGRVMDLPLSHVDRIAKLVPEELKITLAKALEQEPQLKQLVKEDPEVTQLWEFATKLEGLIGNHGTHAAGVVICDKPLIDLVPLFKAPNGEMVATQFEMKNVENVGLLKMDYLGLRTLTVVHKAVELIRHSRGISINVDYLEPNDANAYALLRSGRTTGIFQLESAGMRELAKRIGLESLEEICALVALYRPGPMELKDDYIANKHDSARISYAHPLLQPILSETYGIALYQEQVMQMVQSLAGFTLGGADILRRAMGKKKAELMAEQRAKFVAGCKQANNIDAAMAETLFDVIERFAGYGFNKSHSMAYALVAYQTAYLKANFPVEFMAALLSSEINNLDKVGIYVDECRRVGIEVRPPDINRSYLGFTVEGSEIIFGLGAIKHVGEGPVAAIVSERVENGPFADVFDFCSRIDTRDVNRRCIEALNRAGAFESTGWNRREVEESLDQALSEGQIARQDRESGQGSLLDLLAGDDAATTTERTPPGLDEWAESDLLAYEKEMLGLYVSSHPLGKYAHIVERFTSMRLADLPEMEEHEGETIGGLVGGVRETFTRKGAKMAWVTLETLEGTIEVTCFSDAYEKYQHLLQPDRVVVLACSVKKRSDEPGLILEEVIPINEVESRCTRAVHIRVPLIEVDGSVLNDLAHMLGNRSGSCDVYLHCVTPTHEEVTVHATEACKVSVSDELRDEIESLLGTDTVWYSGGHALPRHA